MAEHRVAGFEGRITMDPDKMGGKPCIRGYRIPVVTVLRCLSSGMTPAEVLHDYPDLEAEDIAAALRYATFVVDDRFVAFEAEAG